VQQHERLACASFDIVQMNAADFDEIAGWRIVAFCLIRASTIEDGRDGQRADSDGRGNGDRMRLGR
jgi:hypothetical protein